MWNNWPRVGKSGMTKTKVDRSQVYDKSDIVTIV